MHPTTQGTRERIIVHNQALQGIGLDRRKVHTKNSSHKTNACGKDGGCSEKGAALLTTKKISKDHNRPAGALFLNHKTAKIGGDRNQRTTGCLRTPRTSVQLQPPPKLTNKQGHANRTNRQALGKQQTVIPPKQLHNTAKVLTKVPPPFPPPLQHRFSTAIDNHRRRQNMQRGKPPAKGRDPHTLLIPYTHQL